jgi:copper chaperone
MIIDHQSSMIYRPVEFLQCEASANNKETEMTESVSLTVFGMKCGGCEANVTDKLKAIDGVVSATASFQDKEVNVEFDAGKTSLEGIVGAIVDAGFTVEEGC